MHLTFVSTMFVKSSFVRWQMVFYTNDSFNELSVQGFIENLTESLLHATQSRSWLCDCIVSIFWITNWSLIASSQRD